MIDKDKLIKLIIKAIGPGVEHGTNVPGEIGYALSEFPSGVTVILDDENDLDKALENLHSKSVSTRVISWTHIICK